MSLSHLSNLVLSYKGIELLFSSISATGQEYLIAYGYRQALADSIANPMKKFKEEATAKNLTGDDFDDYVAEACAARMSEKAEAIAKGTISLPRSDADSIPQSAFEREREKLLKDFVTQKALALGYALPRNKKGSTEEEKQAVADWWTRQMAGALAKHDEAEGFSERARAIVAERKATARPSSKADLKADLF